MFPTDAKSYIDEVGRMHLPKTGAMLYNAKIGLDKDLVIIELTTTRRTITRHVKSKPTATMSDVFYVIFYPSIHDCR